MMRIPNMLASNLVYQLKYWNQPINQSTRGLKIDLKLKIHPDPSDARWRVKHFWASQHSHGKNRVGVPSPVQPLWRIPGSSTA